MVTLFQGLYSAAGVAPEQSSAPRSSRITVTPVRRSPPISRYAKTPPPAAPPTSSGPFPPALAGLLSTLPTSNAGWTKDQRDRFIATFGAVLDYSFPLVAVAPASEAGDGDDK